jgi:multicomponent Na+:H+ antiporter subunit G
MERTPMISDGLGLVLTVAAIPFFVGGSVGLLRFPDFFTRLHALTKADNLGLGFVVIGGIATADSWTVVLKLLLVWFLVLVSSSTAAHLMAHSELAKGIAPWSKR